MAKKKSHMPSTHHVQKGEHTTHHHGGSKAGQPHPHKGHAQSAEARQKISEALRGRKRG